MRKRQPSLLDERMAFTFAPSCHARLKSDLAGLEKVRVARLGRPLAVRGALDQQIRALWLLVTTIEKGRVW